MRANVMHNSAYQALRAGREGDCDVLGTVLGADGLAPSPHSCRKLFGENLERERMDSMMMVS